MRELKAIRHQCRQPDSSPENIAIQPIPDSPKGFNIFLVADGDCAEADVVWEIEPSDPAIIPVQRLSPPARANADPPQAA